MKQKKKGIKVYALNIGQPNIVTPDTFFTGLHNYSEKIVKYSDSRGIEKLIESFIESYKKNDTFFNKERYTLSHREGSEAILFTIMAICNEGDKVLVPEPFYSNYNSFCQFAGAKITPIETKIENNFHLPPMEEIENLSLQKQEQFFFQILQILQGLFTQKKRY